MRNRYKKQLGRVDIWALQPKEIASISGVDESTARRYRRNRRAPEPVCRLLEFFLAGLVLPPDWADHYHFEGNQLVSSYGGERFTPGELLGWHFNKQALVNELWQLRRVTEKRAVDPVPKGGRLRLLEKAAKQEHRDHGKQQPKYQRSNRVGRRWVANGVQGLPLTTDDN